MPNAKSTINSISKPYGVCYPYNPNTYYVIYPDIHGCLNELKLLMDDTEKTIYKDNKNARVKHVFLGDLVDRGPRSYETLEYLFAKRYINTKIIMGNHEKKILRKLEGAEVSNNEDQKWYNRITDRQKNHILDWCRNIPSLLILRTKTKDFFCTHAAIKKDIYPLSRDNFFIPLTASQRDICLYGHTNGDKDPVTNFPIRLHEPCLDPNVVNVFGHITHTSIKTEEWIRNDEPGTTIQLDHGAVHGGHLTAMIINNDGDYYFISHKVNNIYMPSKTTDFSRLTEQRRILFNEK